MRGQMKVVARWILFYGEDGQQGDERQTGWGEEIGRNSTMICAADHEDLCGGRSSMMHYNY